MRIQFICNYSSLYGANRSLLAVISYLKNKEGFNVHVILPSSGSMQEELQKEDVSYSIVPSFTSFLYIKPTIKYALWPFLALWDLIIIPVYILKIRRFNPDIIYSNTLAENFGIFISKILKKKHIVHVREFMSLDHGAYFLFGKNIKRKLINWSDGQIFVSKAVKDYLFPSGIMYKKNKVIYNGIALSNIKTNTNFKKDEPRFGLVGIIDESKRQDFAIESFVNIQKVYPNATLHFFGEKEGLYKRKLLKRVGELKFKGKVIFHGFISNPDIIYNSIDVLLMFSRSEGFGRVTVEAMGHGIPVIGFNNGGTSELVSNCEDGCLFDDFKNVLHCVNYVLDNYHILSKNAVEKVQSKFDIRTYVQAVEKFIKEIAEK